MAPKKETRNERIARENAAKKRSAAKKAAAPKRTAKLNRVELLLQSITEKFPTDPTGPGVSLAWLADRKVFYASIVRFGERYAGSRRVVYSFESPSAFDALGRLLAAWENYVKPPTRATEELLRFGK
jgi:hypothetical protein